MASHCSYPTFHQTDTALHVLCACGWHQPTPSKRRGKRYWQEHRWWATHGTPPPWRKRPAS